jgi:hypothetical protein
MSSEARVLERPGRVSAPDANDIAKKRNQPTYPDKASAISDASGEQDPALRRAFQAAVNMEERSNASAKGERRGLWSGLPR